MVTDVEGSRVGVVQVWGREGDTQWGCGQGMASDGEAAAARQLQMQTMRY